MRKLSGLTKKHFEGLVQVLRETRPVDKHDCSCSLEHRMDAWDFVCHKLTNELADANPAFDIGRFKAALNK